MDFSSRFSLYDVVAMIIPGGLIIAFIAWVHNLNCESIVRCCGNTIIIFESWNFIQSIIFLSAAYIIGLVNNWINDGVFIGFRNNDLAIKNELNKIIALHGNKKLYKSGIILDQSDEIFKLLPLSYRILKLIIEGWRNIFSNSNVKELSDLGIVYYFSYYKLSRNHLIGGIPIIEAQVALLRNLILPLIIVVSYFIIRAIIGLNNPPYVDKITMSVTLFLIIITYIVMVQRQNKVYNLVWEALNYNDI
ncbi:MAG: hypothetical protein K2G09_00630 [Paramuribaculum sp.]|nr:hypothetical protein [Paramuribaculum sp.]